MGQFDRPALRTAWPTIAAAAGAGAGMSSCIATTDPLTLFGALALGLAVTAGVFSGLLRLAPTAPSASVQRRRLRAASTAGWLVCVAMGWRFGASVDAAGTGDTHTYNGLMTPIGIAAGVVLGIGVAMIVMRLGMEHHERASRQHPPARA
jgi:uncharacterized membrane protein YhaH (DUF805 family)